MGHSAVGADTMALHRSVVQSTAVRAACLSKIL